MNAKGNFGPMPASNPCNIAVTLCKQFPKASRRKLQIVGKAVMHKITEAHEKSAPPMRQIGAVIQ